MAKTRQRKKGVSKRKPASKRVSKAVNPKITKKELKELQKLRHEVRRLREFKKSTKQKLRRLEKFRKFLERKEHRRDLFRHRKEIISRAFRISEMEDDYEDYEREEMFEDFREEYDLDLDDWLDIMMAEGYTEHEAYELWYYP